MTVRELICELLEATDGGSLDVPARIEAAGEAHGIGAVRQTGRAVLITTDATLYTERDMIKAACKEPV